MSYPYRLHPVTQVLAGGLVYPLAQAKGLLKFLQEYLPNVPGDLTVLVALFTAPADPMFPEAVHNTLVAVPVVCFAGPLDVGEKVLQPLRGFGSPALDFIAPMPYTALQTLFDAQAPPGLHYYYKSAYVQELGEGVIDVLIEQVTQVPSPLSHLHVVQLGGAISRVGEDETAFSHRDMPYECYIPAIWKTPSEATEHVAWVRETWNALQAFSPGTGYLNRNSDTDDNVPLRRFYGAKKYERLVALKNRYDPTNVFRVHHNIKPTQ